MEVSESDKISPFELENTGRTDEMATIPKEVEILDQEEVRRLLVEDSYETNPKVELQVKNFSSFYGEKQVLKNLNFNIIKTKVTALIGPSGCGKSTLLKSINRMNDLNDTFRSSGEILFLGENIYDKKEDVIQLRKKIGMVFQKPNPFPMSIYDNIVFGPYV